MKALKRFPSAWDIYFWLTYRLSYLRQVRVIPWPALQLQFGSSYAADAPGLRDFKCAFLRELKKVRILYSKAKVTEALGGLHAAQCDPFYLRPQLENSMT